MKAYVVMVTMYCRLEDGTKQKAARVSGTAYRTLEEAQRFCETRGDSPLKVTEYFYDATNAEEHVCNQYEIFEVAISGT